MKVSISSRQSFTCLVLPSMEGFVFFGVHGDVFPPMHPYPEAWVKSCVTRSCPVVGSLFLTIHCSSWIPAEQLSVHLPAWYTRPGAKDHRAKEKWTLKLHLSSRAPLPECAPSTSCKVHLEFQRRVCSHPFHLLPSVLGRFPLPF